MHYFIIPVGALLKREASPFSQTDTPFWKWTFQCICNFLDSCISFLHCMFCKKVLLGLTRILYYLSVVLCHTSHFKVLTTWHMTWCYKVVYNCQVTGVQYICTKIVLNCCICHLVIYTLLSSWMLDYRPLSFNSNVLHCPKSPCEVKFTGIIPIISRL